MVRISSYNLSALRQQLNKTLEINKPKKICEKSLRNSKLARKNRIYLTLLNNFYE